MKFLKDKQDDIKDTALLNKAANQKGILSLVQVHALYTLANQKYLAIPEKFDKLIVSLRTAYAKEYSLDKEQTSYDDLIDACRLALKGYNIT
jgi:hypothetical protein